MELLWCQYRKLKNSSPSYILLLNLGTWHDKLCGIECSSISPKIAEIIRKRAADLEKLDIKDVVDWIKHNCPSIMSGYKTISLDRLRILSRHKIKSLQALKE
jgi:hypothetical protein